MITPFFTILLNHLSLVEQGSHKYVGCGRFSVLHARQIFYKATLKHYHTTSGSFQCYKNCVTSMAICRLSCLFFECRQNSLADEHQYLDSSRFRIGISAETACTENDKDLKQTGVTMTRKRSIQIKKYLQFEDKISCMTGCTTPQLKLNLYEQG